MLITVSRQYGAGEEVISEQVAEALGWTVVDSTFIARVAERAGLPPEEVARHEERIPSFMERLARVTADVLRDAVAGQDLEAGLGAVEAVRDRHAFGV